VLFNFRVNNVLNDRDVIYPGSTAGALGGDYRARARETVPSGFADKNPINFSLSATLKR